jgi:hypothetical protein
MMATTDPFPAPAAASAASQLAAFFPPPPPGAPAALAPESRELAETLAVCVLTADHVRHPPRDLTALARPSGAWHHQVRTSGAPTHVARSEPSGFTDGVEVQQLAETPVAAQIDRALAWADRHVKGRATVRLLIAPAYYLHALLVVRGEEFSAVLADQPPDYSRLEYEREYPLAEFLKLLSKEKLGGTLTP